MQIMGEIALFSGKIYTAGTNFTRPPVVTVATNLNSAMTMAITMTMTMAMAITMTMTMMTTIAITMTVTISMAITMTRTMTMYVRSDIIPMEQHGLQACPLTRLSEFLQSCQWTLKLWWLSMKNIDETTCVDLTENVYINIHHSARVT